MILEFISIFPFSLQHLEQTIKLQYFLALIFCHRDTLTPRKKKKKKKEKAGTLRNAQERTSKLWKSHINSVFWRLTKNLFLIISNFI